MISDDVFRDQPVLAGDLVRLEPMGSQHFEGLRPMLDLAPEILRMTASRHTVTEDQAYNWVATRQDHHDRADWVIVRVEDERVVGEVVFNEFDTDNASVNFRILLISPEYFGRGYGTEATRLAVDYAFEVGLHRVELEVYDFNPRAQRAYEKAGFVREGVRRQALRWEGEWHDAIGMAIIAADRA